MKVTQTFALIFSDLSDATAYRNATGHSVFRHPRGFQVVFPSEAGARAALGQACGLSTGGSIVVGKEVRPCGLVLHGRY